MTIDPLRARRAKNLSRQRKTTLSALIEEMIDRLHRESSTTGPVADGADLLKGIMKRPFTRQELEADERLARIMGRR